MKKKKQTPPAQLAPAQPTSAPDRVPNTYKPTAIENRPEVGQSLSGSANALSNTGKVSSSSTLGSENNPEQRRQNRLRWM